MRPHDRDRDAPADGPTPRGACTALERSRGPPVTDSEKIIALAQQVTYWRNQAKTLNQLLQATRNTPERHHGRTTLHRDPVGNQAAAAVDKERQNRKAP
jgi:hypothetical protein